MKAAARPSFGAQRQARVCVEEPHLPVEAAGGQRHLRPPNAIVLMLAASAGLVKNAGVLLFSIDTRIATNGLAAAIASTYAVVTMLVGLLAFRERLVRSQVAGIGLVLVLHEQSTWRVSTALPVPQCK